jgi:ATP-dependent Lon protease
MSETLTLPVLPLDDDVVLPGMVVPIELTDNEVRGAIDAARNSKGLGRGPGIRSEEKSQILIVPRIADRGLAGTGTLAVIEQVGRLPGGEPGAVLRGVSRVKIGHGTTGTGAALWVEGTVIAETGQGPKATELGKEYKSLIVATLQTRGAWQVVDMIQQLDDPSAIADRAGYASYLTAEQKLQLLETPDVAERLETAIRWIKDHIAEQDVAESIRKDVTEGMEKQQKEFLLRQQLAAVRKELNELTGGGKGETEEDDYRKRVEDADLPENVREAALREVDKLERTSDQSPEVGWIRTWLDTILDIPWNERTEDAYDIAGARRILDEDHTGLDDVKERIIEYLAVRKRRSDRGLGVIGGRRSGAELALVGAGDGPQVRPRRAWRRAGRGGDPRSPAHLRRRAARPDRPGHPRGGHHEPGGAAGRGGQDRQRLPGRPGGSAARGARPGAEPHVPRPLPGGRPRPVRRGLPGHGERARRHPRAAA